jgi:hypothetical protein
MKDRQATGSEGKSSDTDLLAPALTTPFYVIRMIDRRGKHPVMVLMQFWKC